MRHGVIMLGADERIVVRNDAYINMYGLSPRHHQAAAAPLIDALRHRASLGHFELAVEEIRRKACSQKSRPAKYT